MAYFIQTGRYSLHCFFLLLEFNRVLNSGIIIILVATYSHVSVSSSQIKTTGKQTSYLFFSVRSASSDSRYSGEQETHWDKTNKRLPSLKMVIFFVFSQCDSCSLALRVSFLLFLVNGELQRAYYVYERIQNVAAGFPWRRSLGQS